MKSGIVPKVPITTPTGGGDTSFTGGFSNNFTNSFGGVTFDGIGDFGGIASFGNATDFTTLAVNDMPTFGEGIFGDNFGSATDFGLFGKLPTMADFSLSEAFPISMDGFLTPALSMGEFFTLNPFPPMYDGFFLDGFITNPIPAPKGKMFTFTPQIITPTPKAGKGKGAMTPIEEEEEVVEEEEEVVAGGGKGGGKGGAKGGKTGVSNGNFAVKGPNGETLNPVTDGSTAPAKLPTELEPLRGEIEAAAKATGVPASLIAAVIWDESKGDQGAGTVNGGNGGADTGVMQVNDQTYKGLAEKYPDLLPAANDGSAETTIMAGSLYLKDQYETFGNWPLALRAYNSGPGAVDPSDYRISKASTGTKNYVEKVLFFENEFVAGNGGNYSGGKGYPLPNELY